MIRFLIPLFAFIALVVFLAVGLTHNPRDIPSPFIGKPAPGFSLPMLDHPSVKFNSTEMKGKVWLLNVWASWCVTCRAEHQVWNTLVRMEKINLVGLNYKNEVPEARAWLKQHGNPYLFTVSDLAGQVGIDWGVYAVPETFVIDKQGIVRYKQIGAVTHEVIVEKIMPLVRKLQGTSITEQKS